MKKNSNSRNKNKNKGLVNYAKYTSLAIEMAVIIGGAVWLGNYLDEKWQNERPYMTIFLSLFGIFAALYLVIRSVKK